MLKAIYFLSKTITYHMNNYISDVLNIGPNCYERFIDPVILSELAPLEIALAGCSNLSGQYSVARTAPLEHTLFYTLSGQGTLTTTNNEYVLGPNTLAILPAKQSFSISIAAKHWDIVWLNLANTQRWQHIAMSKAMVIEEQKLEPLHLALELLYNESHASLREGVVPIINHYLSEILRSDKQNNASKRLHTLFQKIDKRLQFDWTIEAMCEQVHYSSPHLHRLCKAQFSKSPVQQLIHLRMERAKSLLLNTRWSIQHIASYVGYTNIFNFSKRFKKTVGMSPSNFRRGSSE